MKRIKLNTDGDYFADEAGNIWRGTRKLKGTLNKHWPNGDRPYRRYQIKMKCPETGRKYWKFFYGQRLVAYAYLDLHLKKNEGKIVRHLKGNALDNSPAGLALGTHYDNQVVDRIIDGSYMNRGPGNSYDELAPVPNTSNCPF